MIIVVWKSCLKCLYPIYYYILYQYKCIRSIWTGKIIIITKTILLLLTTTTTLGNQKRSMNEWMNKRNGKLLFESHKLIHSLSVCVCVLLLLTNFYNHHHNYYYTTSSSSNFHYNSESESSHFFYFHRFWIEYNSFFTIFFDNIADNWMDISHGKKLHFKLVINLKWSTMKKKIIKNSF